MIAGPIFTGGSVRRPGGAGRSGATRRAAVLPARDPKRVRRRGQRAARARHADRAARGAGEAGAGTARLRAPRADAVRRRPRPHHRAAGRAGAVPAELDWAADRARLCSSIVGICKAMGGGWVTAADQLTASSSSAAASAPRWTSPQEEPSMAKSDKSSSAKGTREPASKKHDAKRKHKDKSEPAKGAQPARRRPPSPIRPARAPATPTARRSTRSPTGQADPEARPLHLGRQLPPVRRAGAHRGTHRRGFIPDPEASQRPEVREIIFFDTPDFRLYNNVSSCAVASATSTASRSAIRRSSSAPPPGRKAATAVDVRPKIAGKHRIKFKAEALPLKDQVGGYRLLYSHNCQFGLEPDARGRQAVDGHAAPAPPALKALEDHFRGTAGPGQRRHRRGGAAAAPGSSTSARARSASATSRCGARAASTCRWSASSRSRSSSRAAHRSPRSRRSLRAVLRRAAAGREGLAALGVTKTAMVYHWLSGNAPQSHE